MTRILLVIAIATCGISAAPTCHYDLLGGTAQTGRALLGRPGCLHWSQYATPEQHQAAIREHFCEWQVILADKTQHVAFVDQIRREVRDAELERNSATMPCAAPSDLKKP